ncbi:MAG: ATP-binding cassette domain-containing protein [Bacteroidales bacterium]
MQNITKFYVEGAPVVNNVSLGIQEGEFVTVIGPSGCGKTTLLRLINRMTDFNEGKISLMNKDIFSWDPILLRRKIGYVIQQGALFPHLNIKQNIAFVLHISGEKKEVCERRVKELGDMMGFDQRQLHAYPGELSGGQQQRVGIARALAVKPKIILLDEPFSALDNITRKKLQNEIKAMHQDLGITFIMVTHDLQEALKLGDRVALMRDGRLIQFDTPSEIINNPNNDWVSSFINL